MDDTSSRPGRSRGGAPPSLDERALRSRYGQSAVDLVLLLDRLARAGGFSRNDAAQHWAAQDPEGARHHGILRVSDTGAPTIERRRLSETMKMDKGPVPTGLVEAFHELWARQRPTAEVRAVADQLTRLCDEVVQASLAAVGPSTGPRKPRTTAKAAEVARLKQDLLVAQRELIEAQKTDTELRGLSSVLYVALVGLQSSHQRLLEDRNEALGKAKADGNAIHDVLEEAQHELRRTLERALSAERMVQQLQADNHVLVAHLDALQNYVGLSDARVVRPGQVQDNRLTWTVGHEEVGNASDVVRDPTAPPWVRQNPSVTVSGSHRHRLQSGWRKTMTALTGLVSSGESAADVRRRELIARITRPSGRCHKIVVVGVEDGVGGSTVTACLGAVLARLRHRPAADRFDRVIAVDANSDRGTPAPEVVRETTATVRDLLRDASRIAHHSEIRAYTSRSRSGLEVLASEKGPVMAEALSEQGYLRAVSLLERFYDIVLVDCGTDLTHPAAKGILSQADSLVLVSSGSVDGTQTLAATLDWLEAHGYRDLVAKSTTVINSVRSGSGRMDPEKLAAYFVQRCRAVVRIPFDTHLEMVAETELEELGSKTRFALLELAATVTDDFSDFAPRSLAEELPTGPVAIVPSEPATGPVAIVPVEPLTTPIMIASGLAPYTGTTIPWTEKIKMITVLYGAGRMTHADFTRARNLALESAAFSRAEIEREFRALVNRAVGMTRRTISKLIFHHPQFPTPDQASARIDTAWGLGALSEQEYVNKKYWLWEFGQHNPPQVPRADAIYVLDARLAYGEISPEEYGGLVAAVKQREDLYPDGYPDNPRRSWPPPN
ncbi:hypothetical protein IOD16_16285 [Saccharothrix sp. 6-C]|uniref:MinD/ParA family ATP-binding protein n=1 Tax=Saccharothrix sp. 6-C TaxID=2781735 RepID=UPI0019177289|nr:MinD/ParA family protein [Saccharothrix sp. 6-C]QQQ79810.1 hypothetical protein IOD16_16285 [Saccharothrix sp. 6-C]